MRRLSLLPLLPEFPTASELHRARECTAPWTFGLPEAEEAPGEWAEKGRLHHAFAEMLATGYAPSEDIVWTDPFSFDLSTIDPVIGKALDDAIRTDATSAKIGHWFVEQGVKWRTDGLDDEAELCKRRPGERLRGWFSGTADLAYVRADGVLVVADWKFGPMEAIRGEPAQDSCQGFFLALAFCKVLGITGSSAGVVVARFERRIMSEDGVEVDGYDITWGEMCEWAEVLGRNEYELVDGRVRLRSDGDWNRVPAGGKWRAGLSRLIEESTDAIPKISAACGKCKAKAECPAWNALESQTLVAITDPSTDEFLSLCQAPKSASDVRLLHHAIEAGEDLVKEWKRLREAYILTHPEGVEIGLGMKLKAIPSKDREIVDTQEGLDAIERIVPGSTYFERKATMKSIAKAARDAVGKEIASSSDRAKTKDQKEKEAFDALIAAGAVVDKGKKMTVKVVRSDEKEW